MLSDMETLPTSFCNNNVTQMYSPFWPQLFLQQNPMMSPPNCQLEKKISSEWGVMEDNEQHQIQPQNYNDSTTGLYSELVVVENAVAKKVSHNAHERQRRKKLNALYSQLRLLLPNTNPKTKLSIPSIVCGVVNYIPELRGQIQKLSERRHKLLAAKRISAATSRSNAASVEFIEKSPPMVTVSAEMGSCEVVITIYTSRAGLILSKVVALVEEEGLDIQNVSSFAAGGNVSYRLHLQIMGGRKGLDTASLRQKIVMMPEEKTSR